MHCFATSWLVLVLAMDLAVTGAVFSVDVDMSTSMSVRAAGMSSRLSSGK